MGYIKEPIGVDLNLAPMSFTAQDRERISAVIETYKLTKIIPISVAQPSKYRQQPTVRLSNKAIKIAKTAKATK
jgi:hypothetical protein